MSNNGEPSKTAANLAPAIALAAAFPIFFTTHDFFSFGVWGHAEPLVVAFYFTGALCAAALLVVWLIDRRRMILAASHPFVLIPLALAAWSAISALFAKFPMLAILGAPQSGQGALWYSTLSLYIACAIIASQCRWVWRFLILWAVMVAAAITVMVYLDQRLPDQDRHFIIVDDFLAYISIALPFACLRHTEGKWRLAPAAAITASIGIFYISGNEAAILFFIAGAVWICFAWIGGKIPGARLIKSPMTGAGLVFLIAMTPVLLLRFTDIGFSISSLKARHLVDVVMAEAQGFNIKSILLGNGWGLTQEALIIHLNSAGERLWDPAWDFLWRDYFHSHNWFLESLYALGIPGAALTLALFVGIVFFSAPRLRAFGTAFAIAWVGLNGTWFELSFSLPFTAIAMAALATDVKTTHISWFEGYGRPLIPVTISILLACQVIAGITLADFGLRVKEIKGIYAGITERKNEVHFPPDPRGIDYAFAITARSEINRAVNKFVTSMDSLESWKDGERKAFGWAFNDLENRIEKTDSPFLTLSGVSVMTQIMYGSYLSWLKPDYENRTALWREWIEKMLSQAPERTDTAIGYLAWMLANNQKQETISISNRILKHNPDDPVGLYYSGAAMIGDQDPKTRQLALRRMRAGLEKGIERYIPIDENLKKMILSAP